MRGKRTIAVALVASLMVGNLTVIAADNNGVESEVVQNNSEGTVEAYSGMRGTIVNVNTAANIRKGPSTSYEVIGSVAKGTKVLILDETQYYYKIGTTEMMGYVSKSLVEVEEVEEREMQTATVLYVNTAANVRDINTGEVIGSIPKYETVEIIESGSKYKIKYNGGEALIGSNLVKKDDAVMPATAKTTTSTTVYKGPGTSYSAVGELSSGSSIDVMQVVFTSSGWTKVKASNGEYGYIPNNTYNVEATEMVVISGIKDNSCVNIREESSSSSNIVGTLRKGDEVEIIGSTSTHYKIRTMDGVEGYVSRQFIANLGVVTNVNTSAIIRNKNNAGEYSDSGIRVKFGETVDVVGEEGNYYIIRDPRSHSTELRYISKNVCEVKLTLE